MKGTENKDPRTRNKPGDDVLADLFRQVSARKPPPVEDEQLIRQAVHEQWREVIRKRRHKRWAWALAASIMVAVVTVLRIGPHTPIPDSELTLASVEKIIGTVATQSVTGPVILRAGVANDITIGMTLRSETASGLGLRWINGAFIRLDERTELRLVSANEVHLQTGRIYLDTIEVPQGDQAIVIRTPQGLVRHLGTQFMTQFSASGLSISVREGEVMFEPLTVGHHVPTHAGVGQKLEISPGGGLDLETIPTWGDDWTWAEELSTAFQSEGRSLTDLFTWAGRELGRRVEYTSSSAESMAATTVLHGDLDVQPLQALSVATATTDLTARLSDGHIVVSLSQAP